MRPDRNVMKEISQIVKILEKKYGSKNPFYIAKRMGIEYSFPNFNGELLALSEKENDRDLGRMYISNNLGPYSQKIVATHELGHMLMHDSGNNLFNKGIDPIKEFEANYFMFLFLPQFDKWLTTDFDDIDLFNEYITTRIMLIIESEKNMAQSNYMTSSSFLSARSDVFLATYPEGKKLIKFDYMTGKIEELVVL